MRDLPTGAAEVPAKYKGEKWARTGVDVDNGFEPLYVVKPDKKATMRSLKDALAGADELLLATDDDREGEAIAWHLLQELKPKVPARRMVFREITPKAIADAVANPRDLDDDLVDAQETRRILDRLYGYEVSPVLWKKVMPRLSAGRVQSVATRLVVERERERMAFRTASYWDLDAVLDAGDGAEPPLFPARLTRVGERRVARAVTSTAPAGWSAGVARRWCISTRQTPAPRVRRWRPPRSRWPRSTPSPTPASRTRRSAPRRCSRRRAASSASPRSGRCRWPRTSTRPASSPTCGPTRPAVRHRDQRRPRPGPQLFGPDYLPAGRASTPRRSRTRRRRTRPSGRPATPSRPRRRPGCGATSSGSTS